jgi:hypothetical protein
MDRVEPLKVTVTRWFPLASELTTVKTVNKLRKSLISHAFLINDNR